MSQKRYRKSESVVSRKINDEFILVPIRQDVGQLSSIYTLNEVGARIWELIDGRCSVEDITKKIIEEFEVESRDAEADVRFHLEQLEKKGLIITE